jgi:NADH:ubiquinone oxidoreductase subunit 3 (subunit A)
MFSSKTSKLIPIACIVALVVGILLLLVPVASEYYAVMTFGKIIRHNEANESEIEAIKEFIIEINKNMKNDYIALVVLFIVLSVSTLLAFLGRKKNSRKLVLTASILYLLSVLGIPSAILCFIAHAKMKKQV